MAPSETIKKDFQVVGTTPIRHDGADKVTGRAQYTADIAMPGLAYARVLRSPHAHAKITSIRTRGAETLDGVYAVVTSEDLAPLTDQMDREAILGHPP